MALQESDYNRLFRASENEEMFVREFRSVMMDHFTYLASDANLPKQAVIMGIGKYHAALFNGTYEYPIRFITPLRAAAAALIHEYADDMEEKSIRNEEDDDGYILELSKGIRVVGLAVLTAESAQIRGLTHQTMLNVNAEAKSLPESQRQKYIAARYSIHEKINQRRLDRLNEDLTGRGVAIGESMDIAALSYNYDPYGGFIGMGSTSRWSSPARVAAENATIAYSAFYESAKELVGAGREI